MFLNLYEYKDPKYPVQFFIGGKRRGKTYSLLNGFAVGNECSGELAYMRRTVEEFDSLSSIGNAESEDSGNPFGPINYNNGTNIGVFKHSKVISTIHHRKEEVGKDGQLKFIPDGERIGVGLCLSTVHKVQAASFDNVTDLVYDEFIPLPHVRKMTGEFEAFATSLVNIENNRQAFDKPPLNVWCPANAWNIYNAIFVGLGIVGEVEKVLHNGKYHYYNSDRGLAVHILENNPDFDRHIKQSMPARLLGGTDVYDSIYDNRFVHNDFSCVKYMSTKGFRPVTSIGKAYVWRKQGEDLWYISYAPHKNELYNDKHSHDLLAFKQRWSMMLSEKFTHGKIFFESYDLKMFVLEIFMRNASFK